MSMDKVALSSSVEVPESTPVVIRRNSDDDKRDPVGTNKRSSNPFVAFPSTEEQSDEPSYIIPRRHSDDDKRVVDRSSNPFEVTFKTSDFGKKTKVELKNDFISGQDSKHILGVPRCDSGYIENDVHISGKSSDNKSHQAKYSSNPKQDSTNSDVKNILKGPLQNFFQYCNMKNDGTQISVGSTHDQSSQTSRRGSDLHQTTQIIQVSGQVLESSQCNFDHEQLRTDNTEDISPGSHSHSSQGSKQGVFDGNDTRNDMSRKAPLQPQGILRRGSGQDQTLDAFRRNSGPKNNDVADFNVLNDAPRRPSVHFADMPRRNSDPKDKDKEQLPDTLRRSSEPERGYLEQRKCWEQFSVAPRRSSGPEQEYVGVFQGTNNLNQFTDVIRRGSEPKQSFECQEVFPEPARQSVSSSGGYVQNVGIQVQEPFPDSLRNSLTSREAFVVDSGVQTPELPPDTIHRNLNQKDAFLESVGVQADLSRRGSQENRDNSADPVQSNSGVGISASVPKKSTTVDERLAQRRRSLVPMSSMEEESLRERLHMAHLRCCSEIVLREQRYSRETFRKLFQNKEFLEQCFKLFDQDRCDCLEQESWVEFLKQRLTNEKHVDFVEQLESVAFCLCGERPIYIEQFYQIFYTKGITEKLFRLVDSDNSGTVSSDTIMEFLATVTNTMPRTGFDKGSVDRLEQLFRQTVGNGREIKRQDFKKIVTSKNPFFTDRVFEIFDKDNSGTISLQEFLDAMHQFAGQTAEDKIRFLFKVYDLDGDGLIQHKELQHVMRACMEENGMQFSEDQIDDLTMALFEDADANNRGAITYEALKKQLEKHGGLLENLSISIDRWLVPPKQESKATPDLKRFLSYRPYQLTLPYLKNNYVFLLFLLAILLVNAGLFVSRAIQYRGSNWYTIFARACGQCLNFNCAFILVLVLRHTITFLRTRGLCSILPLDNHIYFHKLAGVLIFGYSILHTIMHVCNFTMVVVNNRVLNAHNFTASEWLFTSKPGLFGLIGGLANPTGFILMLILCVMFICSQPFVRRGGCFEIFHYTHLLYVPFWILLILHGPNFWKWFVLPGVAFGLERAYRSLFIVTERGKTYISSGILLPSKVTHLVIKRPAHLDFHAGDYVYVNIPAIAKYEWHPFTLSSAPEQDDYMWLHIRGVGQWTNKLYEYFEKEQEKLHNGEIEPVPCCSKPKKRISNGSIGKNGQGPLQKIQSSIRRTLSKRDKNKQGAVQLVGFSNENYQNDGSEDETDKAADSSPGTAKMPNERNLQKLIFSNKAKLEKSLSVPDMQTKEKKRERTLVLREYMRSESEKSFNTTQIRKARMQSLGLAYLSPQNKSLAQSFRYMRNKPTIIAFKTPSLENCEQRQSSSSFGSVAQVHTDQQRQAEEGRIGSRVNESSFSPSFSLQPVNYPVGKPLEIYIDGPYGAPSSHIFRAQHAVLIATGIGVTPFASILQSIMHKYWKARHTCPRCTFSWSSEIPATVMNLRKVDFFWINRDQRSFEWFVNLLSQLEIEQAELGGAMERFLEMHMYITSALQKTDMKAVGLQLALDLLHEKEKRDLITGLKTRTNAGRPNWDKVFKQIADQKKGKVTIFFCGPPNLARILRVKSDQYGFNFRKEVF